MTDRLSKPYIIFSFLQIVSLSCREWAASKGKEQRRSYRKCIRSELKSPGSVLGPDTGSIAKPEPVTETKTAQNKAETRRTSGHLEDITLKDLTLAMPYEEAVSTVEAKGYKPAFKKFLGEEFQYILQKDTGTQVIQLGNTSTFDTANGTLSGPNKVWSITWGQSFSDDVEFDQASIRQGLIEKYGEPDLEYQDVWGRNYAQILQYDDLLAASDQEINKVLDACKQESRNKLNSMMRRDTAKYTEGLARGRVGKLLNLAKIMSLCPDSLESQLAATRIIAAPYMVIRIGDPRSAPAVRIELAWRYFVDKQTLSIMWQRKLAKEQKQKQKKPKASLDL